MATNIDYIREAADNALYVQTAVGTIVYQVFLVQNTWDGARPGVGNKTQTVTPIYNALDATTDGYVKVHQVGVQDIVLSQGLLKDVQWIVGPIALPYTTEYGSGGYDINTFQANSTNEESYIKITGQGLPTDGVFCRKVFDKTDKSVTFKLFAQNLGVQAV